MSSTCYCASFDGFEGLASTGTEHLEFFLKCHKWRGESDADRIRHRPPYKTGVLLDVCPEADNSSLRGEC
jgi:hypothetical protein